MNISKPKYKMLNKLLTFSYLSLAGLTLSACGGGGGDGNTSDTSSSDDNDNLITTEVALSVNSENTVAAGSPTDILVSMLMSNPNIIDFDGNDIEINDIKLELSPDIANHFDIYYGEYCQKLTAMNQYCKVTLTPKQSSDYSQPKQVNYTITATAKDKAVSASNIIMFKPLTITQEHVLGSGLNSALLITNNTDVNYPLTETTFSVDNNDVNIVHNSCQNKILSPGQTCTIELSAKQTANTATAEIQIQRNQVKIAQHDFAVVKSALTIRHSNDPEFDSDSTLSITANSATQTINLINNSSVKIIGLKISLPDITDVNIINTCTTELAPGQSCQLSFDPEGYPQSEDLQIVSIKADNHKEQQFVINAYTPEGIHLSVDDAFLTVSSFDKNEFKLTVTNATESNALYNLNINIPQEYQGVLSVIDDKETNEKSCYHFTASMPLAVTQSCEYLLRYESQLLNNHSIKTIPVEVKDATTLPEHIDITMQEFPFFYAVPQNLSKSPAYLYSGNVNKVSVSNQTLLAATARGLSLSLDNGNSWQQYNRSNIDQLKTNTFIDTLITEDTMYAATEKEIISSKDIGATWQHISLNSINPNADVYEKIKQILTFEDNLYIISDKQLYKIDKDENTVTNQK